MIKSRNKGSTIEIWSSDYINKTENRSERDKDAEVIQAERANKQRNFIYCRSCKEKEGGLINGLG